ncbi:MULTISPECIES: YqzM family protein [Mammaliicoccus]|uniref:YqzM family protein n=1 Tax=Mammaliicoccus fleurettii TaxID=150056 RepID=A0ABS5MKT5_9STAP|nr:MULTISPECIES: YqzM family protein [Mammaliicoccus]HCN61412.1 YqzM family protein [Staphylococcus sp.]MBL0846257.1 YqzM family protein [Mammaliicoccus fleurettii]MBO3062381.1 YqzM family protein [Mammaliicoccus fleurettii]MBS3671142.1 YqzM family protein [Mammaliicoccus fleurettii]MBS3696484.1 YqzM family protein [Mammaliicoccus fleurettii]
MNRFEGENTQGRNNDVKDSGMGFLVGFLFLAAIYIIAQVFSLLPN